METNDGVLVRRFVRYGDGEAFSLLVVRYADMVYSTCRRILQNEAQAADAVQETFFHLARHAGQVRGSLGHWLHRVATRRAIDLIRQNASRRRREQTYALSAIDQKDTWADVEPAVDAALEELPEPMRELLLLHFLEGRSLTQIASDSGLSQPTLSRRMAVALERLREKLREGGVAVGAVPLQALLLHTRHQAPEMLRRALGKIALAKAASSTAPVMIGGTKIALAGAVVVLAVGAAKLLFNAEGPAQYAAPLPTSARPPNPGMARFEAAQPAPVPLTLVTMTALREAEASSMVRNPPAPALPVQAGPTNAVSTDPLQLPERSGSNGLPAKISNPRSGPMPELAQETWPKPTAPVPANPFPQVGVPLNQWNPAPVTVVGVGYSLVDTNNPSVRTRIINAVPAWPQPVFSVGSAPVLKSAPTHRQRLRPGDRTQQPSRTY